MVKVSIEVRGLLKLVKGLSSWNHGLGQLLYSAHKRRP